MHHRLQDRLQSEVRLADDLVLTQAAQRMGDEGQRQVRDAAVLRLQARQRLELERAHGGRGNAALLQHD